MPETKPAHWRITITADGARQLELVAVPMGETPEQPSLLDYHVTAYGPDGTCMAGFRYIAYNPLQPAEIAEYILERYQEIIEMRR